MSNIIPIEQARNLAPSKMRERMQAGSALSNRFADNVADAFPRLSIKGKVFRVRVDGQEVVARDPDTKLPLQYLDVVLINASPQLAKTYYEKGFSEGDMNPPDCWSLDSIRPDPSILKPINPTCLDCPFNAFGSRVTPDGKAAKACADSRRIVVAMPHQLLDAEVPVYLLRVPQGSLKNMKNYTLDKLARNGYEPGGCISRLTFDVGVAFPKLEFTFVSPVNDDEFEAVIQLATSPAVTAMLRAPDFDNVASAVNAKKTEEVQPQQRQKAPDLSGGFGPGQVQPEEQAKPQQRAAQQMVVEPEPEQQQEGEVELIDTGEGWLNPTTGEMTAYAAQADEAEIDPDVIPIADGRFFNKATKKFVASQYKDAAPAAAVPPAKEEPAKKPAKRVAKPKAEAAAVQQAEEKPAEQAQPSEEPKQKQTVTTASPKLEALLSGLVNRAPSGNA